MKKSESSKTIPFIPRKAEIIFCLPNCKSQNPYYLPQLHGGYLPHVEQKIARIVQSSSSITVNEANTQISQKAGQELRKTSSQAQICQQDKTINAIIAKKGNEQKKLECGIIGSYINQEHDNFGQDIARRKQLKQDLHSDLQTREFLSNIESISKVPPKKKTRRHKTKFHIVKSNKNIEKLTGIICEFINENKKCGGTEAVDVPHNNKNAVFAQSTLDFADQLVEEKQHFKDKYGFDENNLRRNKCLLEQVVLNRMEKRVRNRERNSQLKKIKQMIADNPNNQLNPDNKSEDSDDILARLERPAEIKRITLALPKIQEVHDEN